MHLIRIVTDSDGESHFDQVEVTMPEARFAPPAPPFRVSEPMDAEQALFCTIPAGYFGDWHPAPHRQIAAILGGRAEVGVSDGESRVFGPGDAVLLEDVSGRGHTTRVLGDEDFRLLFAQLPAES
ncbi:MAG: hypothetical protein ACR2N6_02525 [Miltoncostaeaceae bacterium]